VAWRDATEHAARDSAALDEATRVLAEHIRASSERLRLRDELGEKLPALREQETIRAAVLQRVALERNSLDEEERRIEARRRELDQRLEQVEADLSREQHSLGDTDGVIARLVDEDGLLKAAQAGDGELRAEAARVLQGVASSLAHAQEAADLAGAQLSELAARRNAMGRSIEEQRQRITRLEREAAEATAMRQGLLAQMAGTGDGPTLAAAVEAAQAVVASNETAATHAEVALRVARQVEGDTRAAHDDTRRKAERLQTEVRTLTNLLRAGGDVLWPALVDQIRVESGFEAALGAALGDDIDASSDEGAPTHWRGLPPLDGAHALPGDVRPLSSFVQAPQALGRRLSQIGVVSKSVGAALQAQLRPGQRLVSREGDVWRWDGFTSAADAPSAAAKRLAERNRLAVLEVEMHEAAKISEEARQKFDASRLAVEAGVKNEREKREAWRAATASLDVARQAHARHERQVAEQLAQTSALDEGLRRITQSLGETQAAHVTALAELDGLPALDGPTHEVASLRDTVNRERAAYAEARARHDGFEREARARAERIAAIEAEAQQWGERARRATEQIAHLTKRTEETRGAIAELAHMPQVLADKRHRLMDTLQQAETERGAAADALAEGENAVRAADALLREAQELAATSREDHARLGARLEASKQRHQECEQRIAETLQCAPTEIIATAGLDAGKMEAPEQIERRLAALREDRERLGGVNLRAEEEAEAVATQLGTLIKERDDLTQAINKLRGGISSLNREGRQRLLDAFGTVNEKFGELFTTLFGGGKAELQLIESDDPLEAGLEIMANPPGKKPTVLSLLSGGEQTLTALALIFAVFLTNPSPICVLDEVDAPLDDHNVERFCNLLDAMLERTETRFLIITHHELTMARMHRLFGVTMMERGVSQLVSVNLAEAEAMSEAS
jgi:chromosome segregation protein